MPTNGSPDEEAERLKGIAATGCEDHRKPESAGWVTMADPEGDLFCVERSPAEHVQEFWPEAHRPRHLLNAVLVAEPQFAVTSWRDRRVVE